MLRSYVGNCSSDVALAICHILCSLYCLWAGRPKMEISTYTYGPVDSGTFTYLLVAYWLGKGTKLFA